MGKYKRRKPQRRSTSPAAHDGDAAHVARCIADILGIDQGDILASWSPTDDGGFRVVYTSRVENVFVQPGKMW